METKLDRRLSNPRLYNILANPQGKQRWDAPVVARHLSQIALKSIRSQSVEINSTEAAMIQAIATQLRNGKSFQPFSGGSAAMNGASTLIVSAAQIKEALS